MPNLILAISPIISTSDKPIYIPVESEIQAVLIVQAYGINRLDSAELLEYHFGVIDGNPYQEHMSFSDFKARLPITDAPKYSDTYVLCYTDHAGNDQEIDFEAPDLVAAHKIADAKCNAAQGAWTDISLMFYSKGQNVDIPEYIPKSQMMPIDFHEIRVPEYIPTQEEVAAALADADEMNYNMRTYGTIDAPKENQIVLGNIRNSSLALKDLDPKPDRNPPKYSVPILVKDDIGRGMDTPILYTPMNVYTLWYTDECNTENEDEFEALDNAQALLMAYNKCKGCEGLWTGISLTNTEGKELEFSPF